MRYKHVPLWLKGVMIAELLLGTPTKLQGTVISSHSEFGDCPLT